MRRTHRRRPARPRLEALESRNLLTLAGALDPSFGVGKGFVPIPVSGTAVGADLSRQDIAVVGEVVQPDGKVVIAGSFTYAGTVTFALERLDADGTPDATFGQGGLALLTLPGAASAQTEGQAAAVFLQPDGKIIEAGSARLFVAGSTTVNQSFVAIRVNTDGTVDTSYGTGGAAYYPADPAGTGVNRLSTVNAGALLPDGQLVLAGSALSPTGNDGFGLGAGVDFAAVHLNADGSIDTTFGASGANPGTVLVPVTVNGITNDDAAGVSLQSDGQLVLAGSVVTNVGSDPHTPITFFNTEGAAIRLNTDGTPDATFGGTSAQGVVLLPPIPADPSALGRYDVTSVTSLPDDQVLVVGTAGSSVNENQNPAALTKLDSDGTLDLNFGNAGRTSPALIGPAAVQADGKILIAGSVETTTFDTNGTYGRSLFAVLRLEADGTPDGTFGNTATPGLSQFRFNPIDINPRATALAVQADGSVVLAGTNSTTAPDGLFVNGLAAARVLMQYSTGPAATTPPPTPPASFDASGRTDLAVYLPAIASFAYRPVSGYPDQSIPFGVPGAGQTLPAAADYGGTGQTQVAAYIPDQGVYAIRPPTGPDHVFAFGIPGAGQTIPVPADYGGTGKADIAIYMPANASFAILPSDGTPGYIVNIGQAGVGNSIPAPADYFGTGQADPAVYLANFGAFAVADPTGRTPGVIVPFGTAGVGVTTPTPGDYDGSGHVELAVYISAFGEYIYRPYAGGGDVTVKIGTAGAGQIAVPGDYDGSGHLEFAIYDPTHGFFEYQPAGGGADVIVPFGSAGVGLSVPVAAIPGAPPAAQGPSSGSGSEGAAIAIPPGSTGQASPSVSVASTRASAVPSGPMAATVRIPRAPVNQSNTDPEETTP